jgi:hypothetical protein
MINMQPEQQCQTKDLLQQIFIKPAAEVKVDRFAAKAENAECNGVCSGKCHFAIED